MSSSPKVFEAPYLSGPMAGEKDEGYDSLQACLFHECCGVYCTYDFVYIVAVALPNPGP